MVVEVLSDMPIYAGVSCPSKNSHACSNRSTESPSHRERVPVVVVYVRVGRVWNLTSVSSCMS